MNFNFYGVRALFWFELKRFFKTVVQSLLAPVISTSLYFIVFGSAMGSHMSAVEGVSYGAFLVPGLTMLSVLANSVQNGSFGIYMPRFVGTIYEILSAPMSPVEAVLAYVGAAATKSVIIGTVILLTARCFVPYSIAHPFWMLSFLVLTSVTFSMMGFIIGVWADGFDKLQIIPLMVITPLTFLGGSFYSISMLPPFWQKLSLFNPVVYLVSGFRWAFYETSDISVGVSLGMTFFFMLVCMAVITWIFRTGYRLKKLRVPVREVHQTDAIAWLEAQPVLAGCSFISSMPDFTEFPHLSLAEWKNWFRGTARLILERTPHEGVAIFYQRDSKHEGAWVDKAYLIQLAAEQSGHALLWHKIVCRSAPGIVTFGKPTYSHLLCFSRGVRLELGQSTTDLLPLAGKSTWPRGMGATVARVACEFILKHTPTRTVVNPFCGHGMALAAANHLGMRAIGIEKGRKRAEAARALEWKAQRET